MSSQPAPYSGGFIENAPVVASFISADETDPEIATLVQRFKASFSHREVDGHNTLRFFCTCTIPTEILTDEGTQSASGKKGIKIGLVCNDAERPWCAESAGLKAQHAVDETIRYAFSSLGWMGPVSSEKRKTIDTRPDSLQRLAQACREAAAIEGDTPEATRDRRLIYARYGVPTRLNYVMMQGGELKTFPANGPHRENGRILATCNEPRIRDDYEGLENPAFKYLTSFSTPRGGEPLASGEAGVAFDVIDLDRHGEVDGVAAFDSYLKSKDLSLEELLSTCLWSQTKSQGIHIFIKHLGALSRSVAFEGDLKGVEIKSLGSFETLPNSFCRAWGPSEKRTVAEASYILKGTGDVVESGPYYEAFRNLLQRPELHRDKPKNAAFPPSFVATTSSEWERNTLRNCLAATVDKQTDNVANAGEGGRNIALYSAVKTVAGHAANYERDFPDVIGYDVAFDRFLSAAEQCGLGREEAEATIKSGWRAGYNTPFAPIPIIKRSPTIKAEPLPRKKKHETEPHQEEKADTEKPFELAPETVKLEDYPLFALSDDARGWVDAVAQAKQAHPMLIANQLLGLMSGCAQDHADVIPVLNSGVGRAPLSLFCVSIAPTSEGKTVTEKALTVGVTEYEREADEEYEQERREYQIKKAAYEGKVNKIRRAAEKGEVDMSVLPEEPQHPIEGTFAFSGGTTQGLAKALQYNRKSVMLINDEGGQLLRGYNLSGEQRAQALGFWCALWSGKDVAVRLSGGEKDGVKIALRGRRMAWSLCIQPYLIPELMKEDMRVSGLAPRLLLVNVPKLEDRVSPIAGVMDIQKLKALHRRTKELLALEPWLDEAGNRPLLTLDDEACHIYDEEFRALQQDIKSGTFDGCEELSGKILENSMRIAGTFVVWEKGAVRECEPGYWSPNKIDAETFRRAVTLAKWYGHQAAKIFADRVDASVEADAKAVMEIIRAHRVKCTEERGYIARDIAKATRKFNSKGGMGRVKKACDLLCEYGVLEPFATKKVGKDGKSIDVASGYVLISRD